MNYKEQLNELDLILNQMINDNRQMTKDEQMKFNISYKLIQKLDVQISKIKGKTRAIDELSRTIKGQSNKDKYKGNEVMLDFAQNLRFKLSHINRQYHDFDTRWEQFQQNDFEYILKIDRFQFTLSYDNGVNQLDFLMSLVNKNNVKQLQKDRNSLNTLV